MKRDITKIQFKSITGWRGDSLCCPQAFGGDIYSGCSMGCWFCFCREMEEEMYMKWYEGWHRDLVRPCDPEDYRKLFDRAFGSDKPTNDWTILCLRRGLPFNMGSKAETFCVEDFKENAIIPVLELFKEYNVPVIFETKSHFIGMSRYLDIIRELNCAVIVSIMGGSDTLNYKLEPGAPPASMRWKLVEELNRKGVWCGVRWEPIMYGINSGDDQLEAYAEMARRSGARHVSLYNYRTSGVKIALREFESHGYDHKKFGKMLEGNLDESWKPIGKRFFELLRSKGVKASSPDFVNFPFDNDCESCCGVDDLFPLYEFTFQHACKHILKHGSVSWDNMEAIDFREPESYERMKKGWNGKGQYFSLNDSPEIVVIDKKGGYNIYGRKEGNSKSINSMKSLF